jgi:hypothetical protein
LKAQAGKYFAGIMLDSVAFISRGQADHETPTLEGARITKLKTNSHWTEIEPSSEDHPRE